MRQTSKRDTAELEIVPARRAHEYRRAFLDVVTAADVRAIGAALLERAKAGDPTAAKLVLDRVLGGAEVGRWPSASDIEAAARRAARDDALSELLG